MSATFLTGPAGTGKTTYAVNKVRQLLTSHTPANSILIIVPQLTLAQPYRDLLRDPTLPGAGTVDILTLNGLALKTIDLFWPLVAAQAGFGRPHERPIFLSIETAQYYLRQAIDPLLKQGYFDPNVVPLTITLPRLMSQILDNLNKASLIGLPHSDVGPRLTASLVGNDPGQSKALDHAQSCANQFRQFCLERNLLDFSLRIETFYRHLWPVAGVQQFLTGRYRHLIVDNIEEDTPFAHTILRQWLSTAESALLVNDEQAGYRIFLGANWRSAQALTDICDETLTMTESHITSPAMLAFSHRMEQILNGHGDKAAPPPSQTPPPDPRQAMHFKQTRFYPQMIEWVIDQIALLLAKGTPPNEIVVLAPFVSDALRFSFINRMKEKGLAARSHRPSRPLSEEPAAKTVLTLARLAYPEWNLLPEPFDVAQALHQGIADLDLIRANLLTQVVYRQYERQYGVLSPFDQIEGPVRERISYQAGVQFDWLRNWLQALRDESPEPPVLDHFFSRVFDELLSQPGFGFHTDPEAGEALAHLIDSARKFRQVAAQVPLHIPLDKAQAAPLPTTDELNRAYIDTLSQGIMAAQYIRSWESAPDEAVLITPATTFLMSNRPVSYQFWLDAGSSGWWERIAQPLTHPYILADDWTPGRPWTDADEVAAQRDRLYRLVLGLTRRCREQIIIANAEIGEQGFEQRGQLLRALQQMLRRLPPEK